MKRENKILWALKKIIANDMLGALIIFLIMAIFLACTTSSFLTGRNIWTLLRQCSFYAMAALGTLCVFMGGGIDLSIGATMGLSGIICALLAQKSVNAPVLVIVLAAVAVGAVIGAINGFLVGYVKLPAFIETLGMSTLLSGVTLIITKGYPINNLSDAFCYMGTGRLWGSLPIPVVITLILCVITWFILSKTRYGRHLCATGGSEQAAIVSGIDTRRVKMTSYVLCNVLAAISGMVLCARFSSGQLSIGTGYELDAIAAAVIGGASMLGGSGTVFGVVCGTLVLSTMRNGMDLLSVNAYWQDFAQGAIIILAVALDVARQKIKRSL